MMLRSEAGPQAYLDTASYTAMPPAITAATAATGAATVMPTGAVHFLEELQGSSVSIVRFDGASDTYHHPDGRVEVRDLSSSLAGSYRGGTISLNASLSNLDAAQTLYHEFQHHLGANELEARIRTEQFSIDAGMRASSISLKQFMMTSLMGPRSLLT